MKPLSSYCLEREGKCYLNLLNGRPNKHCKIDCCGQLMCKCRQNSLVFLDPRPPRLSQKSTDGIRRETLEQTKSWECCQYSGGKGEMHNKTSNLIYFIILAVIFSTKIYILDTYYVPSSHNQLMKTSGRGFDANEKQR